MYGTVFQAEGAADGDDQPCLQDDAQAGDVSGDGPHIEGTETERAAETDTEAERETETETERGIEADTQRGADAEVEHLDGGWSASTLPGVLQEPALQ